MARRGRKRGNGHREPSGRISRAEKRVQSRLRTERDVVLDQPHRRWLPEEKRADQRAATEIGRLYLAGLITEAQCWAAERWHSLIMEFHVLLATPVTRMSAAALAVSETGEQQPAAADHLTPSRPETEEERRDRVLAQYGAAMRAIRRVDPTGSALQAMEACILHDKALLAHDVDLLLKRGLNALVELWRLDATAEKPIRGIRSDKPAWDYQKRVVTIVDGRRD